MIHPLFMYSWRSEGDSNPRPLPWQGSVLTDWTTRPWFGVSCRGRTCDFRRMKTTLWPTELKRHYEGSALDEDRARYVDSIFTERVGMRRRCGTRRLFGDLSWTHCSDICRCHGWTKGCHDSYTMCISWVFPQCRSYLLAAYRLMVYDFTNIESLCPHIFWIIPQRAGSHTQIGLPVVCVLNRFPRGDIGIGGMNNPRTYC